MTITLAELARIRSAAIGDMLGDPGALDEMGSAATIFRLCRELERMDRVAFFPTIMLVQLSGSFV